MNRFPEIESLSAERIKTFQFEKIRTLIQYAESHSPFYKHIFDSIQMSSSHILGWKDF
jgi:phenylacetate-coenzyme A ligase PaaK-like adenylate-forming protein